MEKIFVLLLLVASVCSAEFADAGSKEAGGRFSFASIDYNGPGDERGHSIVIEPIFNWFMIDQLYLAGKFHLKSEEGGSFFGIGAGIGWAFLPEAPIIPYVDFGFEIIHSGYIDETGLALPLNGGVKVPVFDNVALDFGGYIYTKFINDNPGADFGFAGGVTILIF